MDGCALAHHRWLVADDATLYTQPEAEQAMLLHRLRLQLPPQPPPRIRLQAPSRLPEICASEVPTF